MACENSIEICIVRKGHRYSHTLALDAETVDRLDEDELGRALNGACRKMVRVITENVRARAHSDDYCVALHLNRAGELKWMNYAYIMFGPRFEQGTGEPWLHLLSGKKLLLRRVAQWSLVYVEGVGYRINAAMWEVARHNSVEYYVFWAADNKQLGIVHAAEMTHPLSHPTEGEQVFSPRVTIIKGVGSLVLEPPIVQRREEVTPWA